MEESKLFSCQKSPVNPNHDPAVDVEQQIRRWRQQQGDQIEVIDRQLAVYGEHYPTIVVMITYRPRKEL